jgi:DNA-binding transcriptional LysR family regulator
MLYLEQTFSLGETMKIEEIPVWEAFQGVATLGNFSKAAKALKVTVPQVSKRVAKLEEQLGVRLFRRSTRVVNLTDEGKALLPRVNALLEDLNGIEDTFDAKKNLSGTVRVTCVPFIAHRFLIPALEEFTKRFPGIYIDLDLSEGVLDFVESNIDLAIRIQHDLEDSNLIYRKLAPNDLVFCATPTYLKKSGKPIKKPADLKQHKLLMLSVHGSCRFGGHKLEEFEKSKWITCDNGAFLTDLALHDFGILVRSIWDVRDDLRKGKLIQVLENYPLETFGNIYAVIPSRRYLAPRVRTFLDFLTKKSWV